METIEEVRQQRDQFQQGVRNLPESARHLVEDKAALLQCVAYTLEAYKTGESAELIAHRIRLHLDELLGPERASELLKCVPIFPSQRKAA